MDAVSALRETSVLLVALVSTWLVKERMGTARIVSAVLVCAGLLMVRLSS